MNGVVLGVDRDNGLVRAVLDDGAEIECGYLGGVPPWPLAGCWFTEDPEPVCLGPYGHRREVFHDDFMWGFAPTAARWDADGNWQGETTGTATIAEVDDPGAGSAGAVALTAPAGSSARLRKLHHAIVPPDDGAALWMSARVAADADLIDTLAFARIGLGSQGTIDSATSTGDHGVYATVSGGVWQLTALLDPAATSVLTGDPVAEGPDAWNWLDLVVVPGAWAGLWVDGSGPWMIDSNVGTDASVTPFLDIAGDAGTSALYVDVVDLEIVEPVNDPTQYALGQQLTAG